MASAFAKLFHRRTGFECERCGSGFLCPLEWEPDGQEHWAIEARCGACEVWHSLHLTNAQAADWDIELDRQIRPMRRALDRLDRERMVREADRFIVALNRGLIDAGDFA